MDPINLPDSTSDEPNSHGYVKFRMTPVSTLLNGAQIENVANIYFDFNEPVITAPAVFTVDQLMSVAVNEGNEFLFYPNPAEDQITVQVDAPGALLEIRSSDGRLVKAQRAEGKQVMLGIGDLASGLYVISVQGTSGRKMALRFVKR